MNTKDNYYIGKIAMKPHLLRFVEFIEDLEQGEALKLNASSPIATAIKSHLSYKQVLAYENERDMSLYQSELSFRIPPRNYERGNYHMTESSQIYLNDFLNAYFNQMLALRVVYLSQLGFKQKDIILSFLREIGVSEDEAGFDRVKKAVFRERKKEKNQKTYDLFVPAFVPQMSLRERKENALMN